MKVNPLKSKLKSLYTIFIAPPKEWQLPKKAEVLIYDECGSEYFVPYLTKYHVTTMAMRGENINLPCLLRAMLKLEFWKRNPLKAYAKAYIHAVSPKVVITFIDNNTSFYEISKSFPNIKTILVQNGDRDNWLDTSTVKYKYHIDYMLVFGSCIGTYYGTHITGEVLPIGSLKNNAVSNLNGVAGDGVLFISQWYEPEGGKAYHFEHDGTPVYSHQFFTAEVIALKFLDRWCVENNKQLKICGRQKNKDGHEKEFYADCLKECVWEYVPHMDNYNSYKLTDAAEIVVTIDSTLGYESICRGNKTAAFTCRGSSILSPKAWWPFGGPSDRPNNGPFWTNYQDEIQFQRVMDYLNTVSDEDWKQTRQEEYGSELMESDPGNTRFVALLDQLLT